MEIVFYLARADNGVIGRDGDLPWRLPGDLKRFKAQTMGKPMLMGRRTFESLGRPLPGRRHLVLTRDTDWTAVGAEPFADIDAAIVTAGPVPELAVIGGAEIFRQMLPRADRIELTEVHASPDGDAVVPPFGPEWRETARDDRGGHSFVTLERRR
jgi:dihydrofolate reductase